MDAQVKERTIAHAIAEHVASTNLEHIPGEVVRAAKRVMLDTIGVAWAASDTPGSQPLRALALREGGAPDATLIAYGDRVSAGMAALVNGTLAGALDFDCVHEPSLMHCDIVVLPAVLAVAERQRSSGAEFLAALVLGNDLACQLGMTTHENAGWFYSSLHGAFAAAAASAKLLGLDAVGIRNAMGIAYSSAAGTRQPIYERSFTKRMQTAIAAQAGVQAALLAQCGVTGPSAIFEGEAGLFAMYERGSAEGIARRLGRHWTNPEISLKKYPSCACNHAAIEATLGLVEAHDLRPENVRSVEVSVPPFVERLVGGPFAPGDVPQVDAQFSLRYSVASVILRRRLGVDEILPPAVFDREIQSLAARIAISVDSSGSRLMTPATVAIATENGILTRRTDAVPGTPDAPMSDGDIQQKFRACTARGASPLGSPAAQALIDRVAALEGLEDMSRFFALKGIPAALQAESA